MNTVKKHANYYDPYRELKYIMRFIDEINLKLRSRIYSFYKDHPNGCGSQDTDDRDRLMYGVLEDYIKASESIGMRVHAAIEYLKYDIAEETNSRLLKERSALLKEYIDLRSLYAPDITQTLKAYVKYSLLCLTYEKIQNLAGREANDYDCDLEKKPLDPYERFDRDLEGLIFALYDAYDAYVDISWSNKVESLIIRQPGELKRSTITQLEEWLKLIQDYEQSEKSAVDDFKKDVN